MALKWDDACVQITEYSGIDDAEPLRSWLESNPAGVIDLSGCTNIHTSVLQLLIHRSGHIKQKPVDSYFAQFLDQLLGVPAETPA